ncbi:tRNA dihydrouridine synthase DusB [Lactococcus carnosus]|uniref:tRNA dihydrouridine synthase DusB n=1 Tax=Pseudolactococcus carnosus TaxID=2749961 RepID=UPI001C4F64E6|nr:tRNA dihydrouridine synthase DusB [Lactococcus carnosus]MCJ1971517.1 tRNA dihydrouridine synthase DusB [Lactococcus carnosus]MCJ1996297.1 tRNA dihydrouridine synthase DusB [Lactococcus carnosus]
MTNNYTTPWKIGDVEINKRIVLAPMAGISNKAFLSLAKEFGAGLVVTEMISDKGIEHRNTKTLSMLDFDGIPNPLSIQIFGGDAATLVEAAKFVEAHTTADIIDINMGCPVPKVTKNESGSRLLLDPNKIYDVVSAVASAIDLPVTVKMRTGWDNDHLFPVENALAAEKAGAGAVAMHGRTRAQMYEGHADWDILAKVASHMTIPFIGNGDVKTPADAKRMLDETGVDAVMIGRAALGNPWMLKRTTHFLETGEEMPEPTVFEKIETAKVHLTRLALLKGDENGAREFRQHAAYYLKGAPRAAKVKQAINQANNSLDMFGIFDTYLENL